MIASTIQSNFIGITATKFKTKGDELILLPAYPKTKGLPSKIY